MQVLPLLLTLLAGPGDAPAPRVIRVSPRTVEVPGEPPQETTNPIARALERARPGTTLYLDPGEYPAFTLGFDTVHEANARTAGGKPERPIVLEGVGDVRIVGGAADTLAVDQARPVAHLVFRNLTFVPGNRSAVRFLPRDDGRVHRGFHFEDCDVLGKWNPEDGKGRRSRYGIWGHRLADFRFAGQSREEPARIERIAGEDAVFLLDHAGDVTLENVVARDLGRAFLRVGVDAERGLEVRGDLTVRSCFFEDVGLSEEHGFKGGAGIMVSGGVKGLLLFQGNVFRTGFRASRRHLTRAGEPFGTAALEVWDDGRGGRNGTVILRDNDFRTAPDCGDRALVALGGCQRVRILGENAFSSGGAEAALSLDPVVDLGRRRSTKIGDAYLAPQTRLVGPLLVLGKPPGNEVLARLQRL